jgi:hypothetical protein
MGHRELLTRRRTFPLFSHIWSPNFSNRLISWHNSTPDIEMVYDKPKQIANRPKRKKRSFVLRAPHSPPNRSHSLGPNVHVWPKGNQIYPSWSDVRRCSSRSRRVPHLRNASRIWRFRVAQALGADWSRDRARSESVWIAVASGPPSWDMSVLPDALRHVGTKSIQSVLRLHAQYVPSSLSSWEACRSCARSNGGACLTRQCRFSF